MKAVVFKDVSKKVLKEEYQEGKPDIVRLYRTDTFWSASLNISHAKKYSYKIVNNIEKVNGRHISEVDDNSSFYMMYTKPIVDTIKDSRYKSYYIDQHGTKIGFCIIDDNCNVLSTHYTHEIRVEGDDVICENITTYKRRKENLNKILGE